MFCCLLSSGCQCSVACYFFSISFRCVGLFHLKDSPLLSWCLWEQPCSANWGWVQEWYLLTSLQGGWAVGSTPLSSHLQPSVPSWLQSPDHAAHTLQPCTWLKVFSTQPVGIIHAEIPASEQPGAPVTSWPWPFPSPTSVCPGFLPSLLCFQPVALPPTHWENRMYLAAAPLLHFHPDDTPLPFRPSPVPSSSLQQRRRPPLLCRVCLSHLPPPSGPLCWDPRFCLPPPSACSRQYTNRLTNKILHALPCFSALFIVSFLEELFASPLIHPKKDYYYQIFQAYRKCHAITIYLPFSFVKWIFTFCHICFIPFDRKILLQMQLNSLYISPLSYSCSFL